MNYVTKLLLGFIVFVTSYFLIGGTAAQANTPYDVPSTVQNNWDSIHGGKDYTVSTGRNLAYDIYSYKFTNGGYRIVDRNFGQGNQPYLNFQGSAFLYGHRHHYADQHETYIVAEQISGGNNKKIYRALPYGNLNATFEVSYNSTDGNLWNPCSSSTRNVTATTCNMYYEDVGFDAYIPLYDLFPHSGQDAEWQLYIVKRIGSRIVYTELIVPFEFNALDHHGGHINLSSGVNANRLIMDSNLVIQRKHPREMYVTGHDLDYGWFTQFSTYTRVDQEEGGTTVWYAVHSPYHNDTRWAPSTHWLFGGDQAKLSFEARDTRPPEHISHSISGHRYQAGSTYWTRPNGSVQIALRGYDADSDLYRTELRLGSGATENRMTTRHFWDRTPNNNFEMYEGGTNGAVTTGASRTYNSGGYREITYTVRTNEHGRNYPVRYRYQDHARNLSAGDANNWGNTGLNVRVDGVPPYSSVNPSSRSWTNQNVTLNVAVGDADSGVQRWRYRVETNGLWGAWSSWNTSSSFGQVTISTEGNHRIQVRVDDRVGNTQTTTYGRYYIDKTNPNILFRNKQDTADFRERTWLERPIEVRLKFEDELAGHQRSRHAWTTSTGSPSAWSSWSTQLNYMAPVIEESGEWYLHVQAEDRAGNRSTAVAGPYHYKMMPKAGFIWQGWPNAAYYRGDDVKITSTAIYDASIRHNKLDYEYVLYYPDGMMEVYAEPDFTFTAELSGWYEIEQTVTDMHGHQDKLTRFKYVYNQELQPNVFHTPEWQGHHSRLGNDPYDFYSGEMLLLEAYTFPHAVHAVNARFEVLTVGGALRIVEVQLDEYAPAIWTGSFVDEQALAPPGQWLDGPLEILFTAYFSNGEIVEKSVNIQIIGSAYDAFYLHRAM